MGVRRHVRPLIEYVDERLPDLTQVGDFMSEVSPE
jgi:hypothetical protein